MTTIEPKWWKEAVVYQVYPRSFSDSNGDGIGDLPGLINKLDYLRDLGIDALWLSPVCKTPNRDCGYDISDYCDINPEFGTLADYDRLIAEAHARKIRILLDMVCNHTSDQHPWFIEARASRNNPKRDYYIWHDGKDGHEPNNWRADFGGSAWTFNPATGDYYLGVFSPYQPDLNWTNPEVREIMYTTMRWWAGRGIDGFRLDVINYLFKDPAFPDVPRPEQAPAHQKFFPAGRYYVGQPGIHPILQELRQEVFAKTGTVAIGECHGASTAPDNEYGPRYIRAEFGELDMMFHFDIPWLFTHHMVPEGFRRISDWKKAARHDGWTTLTFNNHDMPRQVSNLGDDTHYRVPSAKAISMLLLTASGTPFMHQGEEIGMTNVAFPSMDYYRDISSFARYQGAIDNGKTPAEALAVVHRESRDNGRTPMQWANAAQAGFSTGTPWLGVNPNYTSINVAAALADPDSILHWYRRLISFRKQNPALIYGDLQLHELGNSVYAYTRTLDGTRFTIILNWSSNPPQVQLPDTLAADLTTLEFCNTPTPSPQQPSLALQPWEARLYRNH